MKLNINVILASLAATITTKIIDARYCHLHHVSKDVAPLVVNTEAKKYTETPMEAGNRMLDSGLAELNRTDKYKTFSKEWDYHFQEFNCYFDSFKYYHQLQNNINQLTH